MDQEGLYIVPGTQKILYAERDEDQITIAAWWFKLASIEETAALNGSDAQFICGEEHTGQTSGRLHFEDSRAILTLDILASFALLLITVSTMPSMPTMPNIANRKRNSIDVLK